MRLAASDGRRVSTCATRTAGLAGPARTAGTPVSIGTAVAEGLASRTTRTAVADGGGSTCTAYTSEDGAVVANVALRVSADAPSATSRSTAADTTGTTDRATRASAAENATARAAFATDTGRA